MHRHAGYQYAAAPAPTAHRYSGTSSAFSASANPNEDWTKISDLAERRRIQNRIAQRNYRKKLKKRLEDLERRAASSSASPEQKPAELQPTRSPRQAFPSPASSESDYSRRTPELSNHYMPPHEERPMFSHQYTDRQLSTSPPPFSYSTYPPPESSTYTVPYATTAPYHATIPTTITPEMTTYAPYLPPLSAAYPTTLPSLAQPMKSEYYAEEDIANPFASGYQALMGGMEIPPPHAYAESDAHTPPLSDSFEPSQAGSPETTYPTTPNSMPRTPPLHPVHLL